VYHKKGSSRRSANLPGPFLPQSVLWGEPKIVGVKSEGYFLWKDEHSEWNLHLRSGDPEWHFVGKIAVQEGANILMSQKDEEISWIKKGSSAISFSVYPGNRELILKFSTDSKVISFDLALNGTEREEIVFIGKNAIHPHSIPFKVVNY
jgi:hypothetical protein